MAGATKLTKLVIRNFRSIGSNPVEIELDEIVVLVGPNNAGKSSILKAYEIIMSEGSGEAKLEQDDFPNRIIDPQNIPMIELHTVVSDEDLPGEEWIELLQDGTKIVREKWYWPKPGDPIRRGYNVALKRWATDEDKEKVPWGMANVANARRPQPHRVDAFDPPEMQTREIVALLDSILNEKVKQIKKDNGEETDFGKLIETLKIIQKQIVDDSKQKIEEIQNNLSKLVARIFPGHKVIFDPKPEEDIEGNISFFKADSRLLVGPDKGHLSTLDKQGSGTRRTILWTALKLLAEEGIKARPLGSKAKQIKLDKQRPHLLLLDEPEICLHPNAIREACDLLYSLPDTGSWQVMITTHSPCFIDFSKDNTTIVRVERTEEGEIQGTTLYRPSKASLGKDDKENLKLLNICDPYVAEFFFGGYTIVVEGDTEYSAFRFIINQERDQFKNVHIIRARGKATIVSIIKILNQFGKPYSVLHDTDVKKAIRKKDNQEINNPAWTNNMKILEEVKKSSATVRLVASLRNFESAFFDKELKSEKPYTAIEKLRVNVESLDKVKKLLEYLCGISKELPAEAVAWSKEEDLEKLQL